MADTKTSLSAATAALATTASDVREMISQLPAQKRKAAAARTLREAAVDFAGGLRHPGSAGLSTVELEVALYLAALEFARAAAPQDPGREEDRLG